jgi:hypothetical protein
MIVLDWVVFVELRTRRVLEVCHSIVNVFWVDGR